MTLAEVLHLSDETGFAKELWILEMGVFTDSNLPHPRAAHSDLTSEAFVQLQEPCLSSILLEVSSYLSPTPSEYLAV